MEWHKYGSTRLNSSFAPCTSKVVNVEAEGGNIVILMGLGQKEQGVAAPTILDPPTFWGSL